MEVQIQRMIAESEKFSADERKLGHDRVLAAWLAAAAVTGGICNGH